MTPTAIARAARIAAEAVDRLTRADAEA